MASYSAEKKKALAAVVRAAVSAYTWNATDFEVERAVRRGRKEANDFDRYVARGGPRKRRRTSRR